MLVYIGLLAGVNLHQDKHWHIVYHDVTGLKAVHKVTPGGSLQCMNTQHDVNNTCDWH